MQDNKFPTPPMNDDGTFKSIAQSINERKEREYKERKIEERQIAKMDAASANDPEQVRWEYEQGLRRKYVQQDEYVIPDGVKFVLWAVGIVVAIGLIYIGG